MIWANPREVIQYARTSYYYNNMFIIYLYLTFFLILYIVFVFNLEKLQFTISCFTSLVPCLKFTLCNDMAAKTGNRRWPRFKR